MTGHVPAVFVVALLVTLPGAAGAQTAVELRGAAASGGIYRYVDVNHTFDNKVVADALYLGVPGSDEIYLGVGRVLSAGPLSLIPMVYGVAGRHGGQRGVALGLIAVGAAGGWSVNGFLGYFEPVRGDVPRYLFMDSLDVTGKFGRWEIGGSAGFFRMGDAWNPLVGPTVMRTDARGAWRASIRTGSHTEVRLIRTVAF